MPTPTNPEEMSMRTLWRLLSAVFLVWVVSGALLFAIPERGTFGDMFGAVNALFSGLAFASIIYTILLQRQELRLQREELQFTRKELEGQKLQIAAQNDVLRQQNFENTFFQSLRLLQDIVNALDLVSGDRTLHGRDCITRFLRHFRSHFEGVRKNSASGADQLEIVSDAYEKFYEQYGHEVGHYFRTLYNIVKLVHTSNVSDKRFYTNLIRAQLSDHELCLLFYNCLSPLGREKFKPFVEHYALLKNLPTRLLISQDHSALYAPTAYGDG